MQFERKMKSIKERIWEKATIELNPKFQDTERNFEYEEPIIDLTLKEVLELIDEWKNDLFGVVNYHKDHGDGSIISRSELVKKIEKLKQHITEERSNNE